MLTFLVLATSDGRALTPDVTATLTAVPTGVLAHEPETRTVWLAEDQHVGFAAWQTRPEHVGGSHWHVGGHGVTAVWGAPLPVAGRFGPDTSWASQLTSRLDEDRSAAAATAGLTGVHALVRLRPDGTGWVVSDALGAGPVHVARSGNLLAVSNDAELAADAVAGHVEHPRDGLAAAALPWVGAHVGPRSSLSDVERLTAGAAVTIAPDTGAQVTAEPVGWGSGERDRPALTALAARLRDAVAAAVAIPARAHVVDVSDLDDARVILAACVAAGVADRVTARLDVSVGADVVRRADSLCADAGVRLERRESAPIDLAIADRRLREHAARTRAVVPAALITPVPLDDDDVLLTGAGASLLRPSAPATDGAGIDERVGVDPAGLLTVEARRDLNGWLRGWADAVVDAGVDEDDLADVFDLRHRLPRRLSAAVAAAAPATVLAPLAADDVVALAATWNDDRRRDELVTALVAELAPTMAAPAELSAEDHDGDDVEPLGLAWSTLYPLLEAELLGRPGGPLDAVLDRDAVRKALREGTPDLVVQHALWAATTAAIWLSRGEAPQVVPRRMPRVQVTPRPLASPPIIITGVTSRSFIELAQLKVPLERTERDPLLAVRVDREVAEFTDRLLVAVDASVGDVPPDIDERLASAETAGFADAARTLVARRNGILADPRLGLTLPFWRAHVADPQVVLVAERPTDLLARLERPLPAERVLAAWLDVVTAALSVAGNVRCVDPDDIADQPIGPEGDVATAYPGVDRETFDELLSVTSVVDSLIRELEVDAVRPIVREIRRARLAAHRIPVRRGDDARYPLAALDTLSELRQRVTRAELAQRSAETERDDVRTRYETLKGRRTVRLAVSAARVLGRPGLPDD